MSKVLVVGGAGYIGSHVCKALVRAGHQVQILDDLSTGFRVLAKYGEFHEGSILNKNTVENILKNFQPDAVMHFAARAEVGESVINPALYYEQNVLGSYNLVEGMREFSPKAKCIFSSTCAVYGEVTTALTETMPLAPVNPYGRSKRIIEEIFLDYAYAYDFRFVSLRYFNAAGADSETELGEMHNPETHLIPRLLEKCKSPASQEVKIFGNDYPTPDGTCIRDYIHVEDLASAHLKAMEYLLGGGKSEIYNLGTTQGSSVLEVIKMVEKVTEKKIDLPVAPRRPGDPARLIASSTKFQKQFSWTPKHNLESIVKTAWNWVKVQGE